MKKIIILLLLLCPIFLYAQQKIEVNPDYDKPDLSPLEAYKPCYFIAGDKDDQVKVNVSFKYNLLKHYTAGLFLGYSQYMAWALYESSSPFIDINYNPEVFIKSKYFLRVYGLDYIQIAIYEHMSNGKDREDNRSVERGYGELQWSKGNRLNIGFNVRGTWYYAQAKENKYYADMTKYYALKLFVSFSGEQVDENAKDEIYIKISGWNKGYQEYGFISRKLPYLNPRLYLQVYHGYLETLLTYDKKDTGIRAGIIFK
jgi:outer membrane phospholipase A